MITPTTRDDEDGDGGSPERPASSATDVAAGREATCEGQGYDVMAAPGPPPDHADRGCRARSLRK